MLDWVSTEDGGHILTVAVGARVLLYAAVSAEVAQATQKDRKSVNRSPRRGMLQKSKSMTVSNAVEEIRWMKVRVPEKGLDILEDNHIELLSTHSSLRPILPLYVHRGRHSLYLLLSTHSHDHLLVGRNPIFPLVVHQPAYLASSALTLAGSVHNSRGDNVVGMWVQLKMCVVCVSVTKGA